MQHCTVDKCNDLWLDHSYREFIDVDCIMLKVCRSGLFMIQLANNPKKTISIPKRYIRYTEL